MKRIIAISSAALMGATMLAAPVYAEQMDSQTKTPGMSSQMQDNKAAGDFDASGGTEAGATTGPGSESGTSTSSSGDLDTGTTAAIGGEPTFDEAIAAIEGNSASAATISGMSEVGTVNVVHLDELEGHDPAQVDEAVTANDATELQSSIEVNSSLSEQLSTQGVEASSVVAAQVEADGSVTVYTR